MRLLLRNLGIQKRIAVDKLPRVKSAPKAAGHGRWSIAKRCGNIEFIPMMPGIFALDIGKLIKNRIFPDCKVDFEGFKTATRGLSPTDLNGSTSDAKGIGGSTLKLFWAGASKLFGNLICGG